MPIGAAVGLGSAALDRIPEITGTIGDVTGDIGDAFGIGSQEKVKGLPRGVPPTPDRSQRVGTIHKGPPGTRKHRRSAPLFVGSHNYGYLNRSGLHDAIEHIEITEPVEVWLYKGVEGGKPAGKSWKVQGPRTVTPSDLKSRGLHQEISFIAVRDPRLSSGRPGGGSSAPAPEADPPASEQMEGGGSPGATRAGGSSVMMILLLGGALFFIANQ